ncbi:MAG: ThuA domain-containing protein [Fimbriimonas sp.]
MILAAALAIALSDTFVVEGGRGPGKGKHVVLLAGDEEYRSEEMLPQLAKILAKHHGFKCTVVFSLNEKGEIDPNARGRQPGIEALDSADVCVMMLRFRRWDDAQMKHFVEYQRSGKPLIALRTSTHAFDYPPESQSPYKVYSWRAPEWKQVVGETWVSHWGRHGSQATRGKIVASHPVLRGVEDVFGTTDVYEAAPTGVQVLMRGEVVDGMSPGDSPATDKKKTAAGVEQAVNDPMMPIVWVREQVLTCTMGAATDFVNPGFRRLLVNSVYWGAGLPVPAAASVELVGSYVPSRFGFDGFLKDRKPGGSR